MAATNYINGTCLDGFTTRETEKAILFRFESDEYCEKFEQWIPKSVVTMLFEGGNLQIIKLPAWFVRKNANINACAYKQETAKRIIAEFEKKGL